MTSMARVLLSRFQRDEPSPQDAPFRAGHLSVLPVCALRNGLKHTSKLNCTSPVCAILLGGLWSYTEGRYSLLYHILYLSS
jgi:hypothetical protein